jgi:hypothetical protein
MRIRSWKFTESNITRKTAKRLSEKLLSSTSLQNIRKKVRPVGWANYNSIKTTNEAETSNKYFNLRV